MSERINALAQRLLGKSSVADCSLEELDHLAKRYPYFAPAQFLLLQKLKDTASPEYDAQYQKAVLYFPDPLQFDFFMSAEAFATEEVISKNEPKQPTYSPTNSPAAAPFESENLYGENDPGTAIPIENQSLSQEVETNPTPVNSTTHFTEPDRMDSGVKAEWPQPAVLPAVDLTNTFLESKNSEERIEEETVNLQEHNEQKEKITAEKPALSPSSSTGIEKLTIQETGDKGFVFEPYHTVDYFASQGIKFSTDEAPKDRLSHQLRSFTDWLKIMKKLPAAEIAKSPQSTAERSVENLASHSVEGNEVVTEAMAEVWAKQGAREKAMETYNKLSLLYPSKKAYFAAKIENLKGS